MSALASGQFASAHEKLGRNHPTLGFKENDLSENFFSEVLGSEMKLLEMIPFKVHFLIMTSIVAIMWAGCRWILAIAYYQKLPKLN